MYKNSQIYMNILRNAKIGQKMTASWIPAQITIAIHIPGEQSPSFLMFIKIWMIEVANFDLHFVGPK